MNKSEFGDRLVTRTLPDGSSVELVERSAHIKGMNFDENSIVVVASDETKDSYGDIIKADGWETERYQRNPVVLIDHNYRVASIVGRAAEWWTEGSKFMVRVQMDDPAENQMAAMVLARLRAGSLNTVSVGFSPIEYEKIKDENGDWTGGYRFLRQSLNELSWVAVPANPNATVQEAADVPTAPESEDQEDDAAVAFFRSISAATYAAARIKKEVRK